MNWIESIFGKKQKSPPEIKFDELPAWLESKEKELSEDIGGHAASVYSDLEAALGEMNKSTRELEEAVPEGRFHLKMVKVARTNRDNMVKQLRMLADSIAIPKSTDIREIIEFHENAMQTLNVCLENMMKSYQYTKLVFLDDSKRVIADVNAVGRLLNRLIEPINDNKKLIDAIENVSNAAKNLKELRTGVELEKSSIKENEEKEALLKRESLEQQEAIARLKEGEEWMGYMKSIEESKALENDIKKTESEINSLILPLNKALNRLKQLSDSGRYTLAPQIREGLHLCLSDPKSVDPEFFIEFHKIVESDVLKLERMDKMLENLRQVETSFGALKKQYNDLMLEALKKKDKLSKLKIAAEEKNLRESLAALKDKLGYVGKELESSKKRLASLEESVGQKKRELQQTVSFIDSRASLI